MSMCKGSRSRVSALVLHSDGPGTQATGDGPCPVCNAGFWDLKAFNDSQGVAKIALPNHAPGVGTHG